MPTCPQATDSTVADVPSTTSTTGEDDTAPRVADSTPPSSDNHTANASIGKDNTAPWVVNPTPTSKDQDDKFSFLRL